MLELFSKHLKPNIYFTCRGYMSLALLIFRLLLLSLVAFGAITKVLRYKVRLEVGFDVDLCAIKIFYIFHSLKQND